ncbi:DUF6998 domain-containing protein [Novosphingobium sp.]|uniref:DUF6998 domain-containing protein n=1 Tax=Novosphingobium sp. TaxID=1874826 RepID=UPI003D6CC7C1
MPAVGWAEVQTLLDSLHGSAESLEALFPGRKFTLDGHLVGSIGEVIAAYMFDLTLNPASTMAHDALCPAGRRVKIKFTQGRTVAIRHEPAHLLVLHRARGANVRVVYNGPGAMPWTAARVTQSNGQRPISLALLARLDDSVSHEQRPSQIRPTPI